MSACCHHYSYDYMNNHTCDRSDEEKSPAADPINYRENYARGDDENHVLDSRGPKRRVSSLLK